MKFRTTEKRKVVENSNWNFCARYKFNFIAEILPTYTLAQLVACRSQQHQPQRPFSSYRSTTSAKAHFQYKYPMYLFVYVLCNMCCRCRCCSCCCYVCWLRCFLRLFVQMPFSYVRCTLYDLYIFAITCKKHTRLLLLHTKTSTLLCTYNVLRMYPSPIWLSIEVYLYICSRSR